MKAGWETKSLGDVCKTGSGGTPLKSKKEFYENGTIPWLMSGEVSQGEVHVATRFITQKGLENSSARVFPKNTVLVAMYGATAGQVGILKFEASTNQAVCGILPSEQFIPEFLYYLFLSKKDELISQATGNAQPNISQIKIKNTHVPIIKLSEQQRIVTILDEAFAGIATATANAEKNLANAREVFESYLHSVFTHSGEGWKAKTLGEVCAFENGDRGVNYPSKSIQTTSGVPFINAGHLTDDGIDLNSMNYIPRDRFDLLGAGKIRVGDILFCLRGSLGKCASVGSITEGAIASSLVILRPDDSVLNSFVLAYLRSHLCAQMIEKYRGGAAQPNLSAHNLKQFIIAVPPMDTQHVIMAKLDDLSAETKKLEAIYQQKLVVLGKLKKSILNQAFRGKI